MAKSFGPYNFRYQAERERFYDDVREHRKEIREELGDEIESALRLVFDIGEHSQKDRVKAQQDSHFQGIRTFRDLRRVKRFLNSSREGGSGISWGRKDLSKHKTSARLCYYKMRGNRVVGEEVLRRYIITNQEK